MNSNTFELNSLLRENVRKIKPYSTARDEYSGVAFINLDANENPYGSIGKGAYNRYPDPYQTELKQLISHIKNVNPNQIFLGNGSDEGIDLLYTIFCNPGKDNSIICPPTYGMYKVSADTNDIACIEVPLTADFQLQTQKILDAVTPHTKLIWLCSPNNPSGNSLQANDIKKIIESFNGIVIIDEAYIDFCPEQSWLPFLEKYPNLVVLQTFSKAWGLANIRLGMLFASPEIIAVLNKVKLPYNLSGLVQEYAYNTIKNNAHDKDVMVADILKEKLVLENELKRLSQLIKLYASNANFVLAKLQDAHKLYLYLVEKGIIVRDRSKIELCENCLRITIGTEAENRQLLKEIQNFYTKHE